MQRLFRFFLLLADPPGIAILRLAEGALIRQGNAGQEDLLATRTAIGARHAASL
jgi:hypothetical protein